MRSLRVVVRLCSCVLLFVACSRVAQAEDEPYLLGDLGVRVELPAAWKMERWSDWDFKAESGDGQLRLFAWATPVQQEVVAADAAAWAAVHQSKVEEIHGNEPKVLAAQVAEIGGRTVARSDIEFVYTQDRRGVLVSASLPVEGQMFHLSLLTASVRLPRAQKEIAELVAALEVRSPPAAVEAGASVSSPGMSTRLPEGWRAPLDKERSSFGEISKLVGVEDLGPCWTALRPRAGVGPDLLFSCPGGHVLDVGLGLADAASFAEVDEGLRPRLFGQAPVAPAELVQLADRVGFLYAPDLGGGRALRMGVVAHGGGLARIWAHGPADAGEGLSDAVRAAMLAASFEGGAPVSLGEQFSYALAYNPSSPLVLGPGLLVLVLVGGAIYLATSGRKDSGAELDEAS